ncbi:MAG: hypothetical protein CFE45_26725 [Burkholderiales bacterium PBB5]|nr:MAG: hypothetical protein CFE45_26725 [Burkholderiales bacterium PBB5]
MERLRALREARDADADAQVHTTATGPVPGRPRAEPPAGTPVPPAPTHGPASTHDQAQALRAALRAAHWNVSAAARALGCSRMTLYRRMARWGVQSPSARDGLDAADRA